ncbi:MAG: hypothetical protein EA383_16560 [Spirochaetaceae bacterium]|nr:MAG: hypothetical protein EA383_16560 [Spirochaetaceae bacterium]
MLRHSSPGLIVGMFLMVTTLPAQAGNLQYVSGVELGLLYPTDSSVGYMDIDIFRAGRHWPDYGITASVGLVRILIQTIRYRDGVLVFDDHHRETPVEYSFSTYFPVSITYSPLRLLQTGAFHIYPHVFGDLFFFSSVTDRHNNTNDAFGLYFNTGFAVQTDLRNILGERFGGDGYSEVFFPVSLRVTYHHLPEKRTFTTGLYFDLGGYFRPTVDMEENNP